MNDMYTLVDFEKDHPLRSKIFWMPEFLEENSKQH